MKTAKHHPSLAIFVGILAGLCVWLSLSIMESPSFFSIAKLIFGDKAPKAMFGEPGYYWIHRSLVIFFAGVGGAIGCYFSRWPAKKSCPFLFGCMLVVAFFCLLAFRQ